MLRASDYPKVSSECAKVGPLTALTGLLRDLPKKRREKGEGEVLVEEYEGRQKDKEREDGKAGEKETKHGGRSWESEESLLRLAPNKPDAGPRANQNGHEVEGLPGYKLTSRKDWIASPHGISHRWGRVVRLILRRRWPPGQSTKAGPSDQSMGGPHSPLYQ